VFSCVHTTQPSQQPIARLGRLAAPTEKGRCQSRAASASGALVRVRRSARCRPAGLRPLARAVSGRRAKRSRTGGDLALSALLLLGRIARDGVVAGGQPRSAKSTSRLDLLLCCSSGRIRSSPGRSSRVARRLLCSYADAALLRASRPAAPTARPSVHRAHVLSRSARAVAGRLVGAHSRSGRESPPLGTSVCSQAARPAEDRFLRVWSR